MHILLTDVLACPRCGPEFGLIVLAETIDDRRVLEGRLGCANCRESYSIAGGVADLRPSASSLLEIHDPHGRTREDRAFRVAALLGVQPPGSRVLLLEVEGRDSEAISSTLPEAHVISCTPAEPGIELLESGGGQASMFSRVIGGRPLPFCTGTFRAAGVLGEVGRLVLTELVRVIAVGGRIVVDGVSSRTADELVNAGFDVHLDQDGTVVAATPNRR